MSISPEKSTAAVLGLGIIGSRVFARLKGAGWQVRGWNRTPKGLSDELDSSEKAIAGASVVSLFLKDSEAVREVLHRIGPQLQSGQIVLNHSTIDLDTTRWLKTFCEERQCRFLDAPFTGSKDASANGKLLYYLGGPQELVDEVSSYLMVSGRALLPCGKTGDATIVKLAMNLVSACTVQALSEALAVTLHSGIDPQVFAAAAADSAFSSPLVAMKIPAMLAGDHETHFSLANMEKDSRYALSLAAKEGIDLPAIAAVSARMAELSAQGWGDKDFSVLAKPYLDPP